MSIPAVFITICFSIVSCDDHSDSIQVDNLPNIIDHPIVSTGQTKFFDNFSEVSEPQPGEPFYGQNGHYIGTQAQYIDNGDGTITDMITGLMWSKYDSRGDIFDILISQYTHN